MKPNDENNTAFGNVSRKARKNGVEVYAFKCKVKNGGHIVDKEIEVKL